MAKRLGVELSRMRLKKGVSLRAVQAATNISNAYISQLERGVATNPTPAKLKSLADYFGVPYLDLLGYAGYLPSGVAENPLTLIASSENQIMQDSPLPVSLGDLSDDEKDLVFQYIEFLKSRRRTKT